VEAKDFFMTAFKGPDGQEDMPYLLGVGPVTTSRNVKLAMLADFAAADADVVAATRFARKELHAIAGAREDQTCVLIPGSAAMAIEATIGSLCPARRKKTLVICNGVDGESAALIMERVGRPHLRLTYRETSLPKAADVEKTLDEDRNISHVWLVHCETSTGMLNPLAEIAAVVKAKGRMLIVDATSTFAGVSIDMAALGVDVVVGRADACLESIPGVAFVIAPKAALDVAMGEGHSTVLDLHAQWKSQEVTGQFLTTPPTHSIVALREALRELAAEGGVGQRAKRYKTNADALRERLKALGLSLLLDAEHASPIVQTVLAPRAATFEFQRFADSLRIKGFAICSGALANRQSFRIGCIGRVDDMLMQHVTAAIEDVLNDMDVRNFVPSAT
jgi:2-aminoethylphosphonate-pyruvate transaminase